MISFVIMLVVVAIILSFAPIDSRITALILLLIVLVYFFGYRGSWKL